MNPWKVLGISPTNDKKMIKQAYAKLSRLYHPEDNPEEFQKLQKAYQEAIKQAGNYRPSSPDTQSEPEHLNVYDTLGATSYHSFDDKQGPISLEDVEWSHQKPSPDEFFDRDDELFMVEEDVSLGQESLFSEEVREHENEMEERLTHIDYLLDKNGGILDKKLLDVIMAAVADWQVSTDTIFMDRLDEKLVVSKWPNNEKQVNLLRKAAKSYHLSALENAIAFQKAQQYAILKKWLRSPVGIISVSVVVILFYFRFSSGYSHLSEQEKPYIPEYSYVDVNKIEKNIDDSSAFLNKIPTSENVTDTVSLGRKDGRYYIENSQTKTSMELKDIKQAAVLPIRDEGVEGKAIIVTKDYEKWQLLQLDGNVRGDISGEIDFYGTIIVKNGNITVETSPVEPTKN